AEAVEDGVARRARSAPAPASTTTAPARLGLGRRRRGRRRRWRLVTAAKNQAAPVAGVEYGLLAIVASDLPVHQRRVERGLLLIVGNLAGEVVEQHRLPARRLERQFRRRRVALRRASARAAARALRQRRRRPDGRGEADRLQQVAAGDSSAVVSI